MIVGIGTDLVVIDRFKEMLARRPGIAQRLLTERELELSVESQAARFSAKEALAKALGAPPGLRWEDCEVVSDDLGRPSFVTSGSVAERLDDLGATRVHLSISHDAGVALAMVVCEG